MFPAFPSDQLAAHWFAELDPPYTSSPATETGAFVLTAFW
jgi:hypothetical protein